MLRRTLMQGLGLLLFPSFKKEQNDWDCFTHAMELMSNQFKDKEMINRIATLYVSGFLLKFQKDQQKLSYIKDITTFIDDNIILYSKDRKEKTVLNKSGIYGYVKVNTFTGYYYITNSVDWENKYNFTCQDVLDEVNKLIRDKYMYYGESIISNNMTLSCLE